jgi:hypothetical protein
VRHETSPKRLIGTHAEVAQQSPKQVKAFLLLPLGLDYGGPNNFYVVDEHERYEDPVGIFKSRSAAAKFAKDNPDAILGNRDLYDIILALAGEDFSFGSLPTENQKRMRDVLEIDEEIELDRGARNFKLSIDLQENSQKALEVLGESAYRILEMQIEESDFQLLQSCIKVGRFDMKLRNKIAKIFDLEFADWLYEMYVGEDLQDSNHGTEESS